MKRAFQVLGPVLVCIVCGAFAGCRTMPATTVPSPRSPSDLASYVGPAYAAIGRDLDGAVELDRVRLLLLGDSLTYLWRERGSAASRRFFNTPESAGYALNAGVPGDRTEHLLHRLRSPPDGSGQLDTPALRPQLIVLLIGTNNLWNSEPADIRAGIEACLRVALEKWPEAKVLVCSLPPHLEPEIEGRIRAVNEPLPRLKETVAGDKAARVFFFDLHRALMSQDPAALAPLYRDETHPNEAGYDLWFQSIEATLRQHLGA